MGDLLPFARTSRPAKTAGRGLCQHGVHKWAICQHQQFDVKAGKLITLYRCARCGKQKVKLL